MPAFTALVVVVMVIVMVSCRSASVDLAPAEDCPRFLRTPARSVGRESFSEQLLVNRKKNSAADERHVKRFSFVDVVVSEPLDTCRAGPTAAQTQNIYVEVFFVSTASLLVGGVTALPLECL